MTKSRSRRLIAGVSALLLVASSCASTATLARRPTEGPFAVPGVADGYMTFGDAQFGAVDVDGSSLEGVPAGAGLVRAMGVNEGEGVAVVAYDTQLVVIDMMEMEPVWSPLQLHGQTVQISAYDNRATVTSGNVVQVFSTYDSSLEESADVTWWLQNHELDTLLAAAPVEGGVCLIGAKSGGNPKVVAQKMNTTVGDWKMGTAIVIPQFSQVHCVSLGGQELVLGGIKNRRKAMAGSSIKGSMGSLMQNLVMTSLDLEGMESVELMNTPMQARNTWVRGAAKRESDLAVILGTGHVSVYRLKSDGSNPTLRWEQAVPGGRSVSWGGENRLIVATSTGDKVFEL